MAGSREMPARRPDRKSAATGAGRLLGYGRDSRRRDRLELVPCGEPAPQIAHDGPNLDLGDGPVENRPCGVCPPFTAMAVAVALALPAAATPPGAKGTLVFERPTANGADLFSMASDGSGLTRLTNRRGVEGNSSWSPDGTKIAFAVCQEPGRDTDRLHR